MIQGFKVFLINLEQSIERLNYASAQLEEVGVEFSRIDAVDGREINLNLVDDCDVDFAKSYYGRALIGAEYGCYKSHLKCARKIIEDGLSYALVLEDDITITGDVYNIVQQTIDDLNHLGVEWDLVNLGSNQVKIYTEISELSSSHKLVAAHYFPQTAHAILWSRKGAERFVLNGSTVKMTVDNYFRHVLTRSGRGYAVVPPIIHQSGVKSIITGNMNDRRDKEKTWNYGLLKQKRFWTNRIIALFKKSGFTDLSQVIPNFPSNPLISLSACDIFHIKHEVDG